MAGGVRLTFPGNDKLRNSRAKIPMTQANLQEWLKCQEDFLYFCKHYGKIVHPDHGLIPFEPRPFQVDMFNQVENNRFVIAKIPRQYGKTVLFIMYLIWKAIFNDHTGIGIFANIEDTAKKNMRKILTAYEALPLWMQQGVIKWNESSIILDNGSFFDCGPTTPNSGRGSAYKYLFMDEFAFVAENIQDAFYKAINATISSSTTSKMFIVSTPNGMNQYWKIWDEAIRGKNSFVPIEVHWSVLPGRDAKWKAQQIANTSQENFDQEFGCEFLGSAGFTLIAMSKIKAMPHYDPVEIQGDLKIFNRPIPGHVYVLAADTAQGVGLDYSAFSVIDATEMPYVQVATFRNNKINQLEYPLQIYKAARYYNDAFVIIEINDGRQVGDLLYSELEYEHQLFTWRKYQNTGQKITLEYANGANPGIQMNSRVKLTACGNLKNLVENSQLLIQDIDTKAELSHFIKHNHTWQAEAGYHDDLVMTVAMFAWLATQNFFKELSSDNLRQQLRERKANLESEVDKVYTQTNGIDHEYEEHDGMLWHTVGGSQESPIDAAWKNMGVARRRGF